MKNSRFLLFSFSVLLLVACSEAPEESAHDDSAPESGASSAAESVGSREAPEGMVLIPGGAFLRGGDAKEEGGNSFSHGSAYPIHEVQVDAFWMDETEVTNRQFKEFVEATGYKTFAERELPEERIRELKEGARRNIARLELMANNATGDEREEILETIERISEASEMDPLAGSMVFAIPEGELRHTRDISKWWKIEPTASWRTPGGPGTSLDGLEDHPVVNVTYEDAAAYAEWAGKRLPTEAEWEKAARGGLEREPFVWGSELFPKGERVWLTNIWQGEWPHQNTEEDGFFTTAPVKQFPPNGYGLYDVAGNVWEIVADLFHPAAYTLPSATVANSTGPSAEEAIAPDAQIIERVTKGGSFLCSAGWCKGYQPGSRQPFDNESPSNHTGFRCAMDVK